MRAMVSLVLLAACYKEAGVTPCTLTCDGAACPGNLVCGSDLLCQTPGMPLCSTITGDGGDAADGDAGVRTGIYVKSPTPAQDALFGRSVALSLDGNRLAVGAPGTAGGQGAVYVYTWDGTNYVFEIRLDNPVPDPDDQFGASVSLSADGDVLAIGDPFEDSNATGVDGDATNNAAPDAGAVYLFTRSSATTWPHYYLKMGTAGDEFGTSVALSSNSNYIAIGAPGNIGVYRWRVSPTLVNSATATGGELADRVGTSVAIADTESGSPAVLAGAPGEDSSATGFGGDASNNSAPEAGAMHYVGFSSLFKYYFKASNTEAADRFGQSVACSSGAEVIAAGALDEDSNGDEADNSLIDSGAVYIYSKLSFNTWSQRDYLKAPTIVSDGGFGKSLALSSEGDFLVVGAPATTSSLGSAYLYAYTQDGWHAQTLAAANADPGDAFGSSVAISRNHFVTAVGAPLEASASPTDPNDNSAPKAGAVYVFR